MHAGLGQTDQGYDTQDLWTLPLLLLEGGADKLDLGPGPLGLQLNSARVTGRAAVQTVQCLPLPVPHLGRRGLEQALGARKAGSTGAVQGSRHLHEGTTAAAQ